MTELNMSELASAFSFDAPRKKEMSTEEVIQHMLNIARVTNTQWGNLDKEDGYNCPICNNKGEIYKVYMSDKEKTGYEYPYMKTVPCSCMNKRIGYQRSRMSGLPEGYEFGTFRTDEQFHADMKRLCERYFNDNAWKAGDWLYIGGAVGCGKTHIVTALARELVYERNVVYMNWVRDGLNMKSKVTDALDYQTQLRKYTETEVLFIDDFLKGNIRDADSRLAYDILNERYLAKKPTLFTSELYADEIPDDGVASRIAEMAKNYTLTIKRDKGKDMRRR